MRLQEAEMKASLLHEWFSSLASKAIYWGWLWEEKRVGVRNWWVSDTSILNFCGNFKCRCLTGSQIYDSEVQEMSEIQLWKMISEAMGWVRTPRRSKDIEEKRGSRSKSWEILTFGIRQKRKKPTKETERSGQDGELVKGPQMGVNRSRGQEDI